MGPRRSSRPFSWNGCSGDDQAWAKTDNAAIVEVIGSDERLADLALRLGCPTRARLSRPAELARDPLHKVSPDLREAGQTVPQHDFQQRSPSIRWCAQQRPDQTWVIAPVAS